MSCGDIFLGLIAVLFPPIAVWIKSGLCSADSLLNILLCMLGYLPGLLHAWYIIAKHPEHDYDRVDGDVEGQQRVTYYYISHEPAGRRGQQQQRRQGQHVQTYGTVPAPPGNKPQPQNGQYQSPQVPFHSSQQQSGVVRNDGPSSGSRPAPDDSAPPAYSEVVRGDHKIQSQD